MNTIPRHPNHSAFRIPHSPFCILHSALLFLAAQAAVADGVAEATPFIFDLDTRTAYSVVSRTEPVGLPYGAGATVTATAPDGTTTTLPAAVNGTNYWTATSGGIWTLENSNEGMAQFAVRYTSVEQGAGTEASPWKLVDNTELGELSVSQGFVFALEGPLADLGKMSLPAGLMLSPRGDGLYGLATATDGAKSEALAATGLIDTEEPGPDRRLRKADKAPPFAYSGDDWGFDPSAASLLTFISPRGRETAVNCTGTGSHPFYLRDSGIWTVTLTGANVTSLTAHIYRVPQSTTLLMQ